MNFENIKREPFIEPQDINRTLEVNYMPYAMSVIVSRAIPEIDGFKPAHRKLLYTMYKMGLMGERRIKSADVVGQTMSLNPHGDAAIYETLVRLTRGNDALLHPFIDSKGNFGKQFSRDMAYAASRYTEVRLDGFCEEIFGDIEKNTVDFIDNYNQTTTEPVLFPTTFPNLLVCANVGIAVGMSCSMPGFNLAEVCALTAAYIKNKNCDVAKFLNGPDFSTGGLLALNELQLAEIYETGRGSVKIRAKYRFDKKNSCVEIYEIPYTTSVEAIIDKIAALIKSGKLREINDVRDETDLKGLKIAIDIKKSANADAVMQRLYQLTPLADTFACNFNFLINGKPRAMGIREILEEWLYFRTDVIARKTRHDLAACEKRKNLLDGLMKILLDIDRVIKIIRNTADDSQVTPNLMKEFALNREQAEYVADIKLRNLNKEYILKRAADKGAIDKEMAELRDILNAPGKIDAIIIKELNAVVKKYGRARRTEAAVLSAPVLSAPDAEDYAIKLFLTRHNYIKKIALTSLRTSPEQNLKDDDVIIRECDGANSADALFFSDMHSAYKIKVYDLPDCKASALGEYAPNALGLEGGEKIIFAHVTKDYEGFLLFAFENGKMAKVALKNYQTVTNRKKLINAYSNKSPLAFVGFIEQDADFVAVRANTKAALFNSALLPVQATRSSGGERVITLTKKQRLTAVMRAENFSAKDIEYYRVNKTPHTGHFIAAEDAACKLK